MLAELTRSGTTRGDDNFYLGIGSGKLGVVDANDNRLVTVISGKGGHSVADFAGDNHLPRSGPRRHRHRRLREQQIADWE